MGNFEKAIPYVLKAEGGFLQDKDGLTYMGLCEKDTADWGDWAKVKASMPLKRGAIIPDPALTASVMAYYKATRWAAIQGDGINDWRVSTYILDWYVNSGGKAVMRLQDVLAIKQTGHLGNLTLEAINNAGPQLLLWYHERRMKFYHDHVALVPEDAPLLKGWLTRCINLYNELTKNE